MSKRVLIIGQSFSTIRVEGTPAFSNDYSGKRLRRWFGFESLDLFNEALARNYRTTNLVLEMRDDINESDMEQNKSRLKRLIFEFNPDVIVLVGAKARNYILENFYTPTIEFINLPHPSTKNKYAEGKDDEITEMLETKGLRYFQNRREPNGGQKSRPDTAQGKMDL